MKKNYLELLSISSDASENVFLNRKINEWLMDESDRISDLLDKDETFGTTSCNRQYVCYVPREVQLLFDLHLCDEDFVNVLISDLLTEIEGDENYDMYWDLDMNLDGKSEFTVFIDNKRLAA